MENKEFFTQTIVDWFSKNQRDLSWRKTRDPYKIWVSEIILQQTQVSRGLAFYNRFVERFPTVYDLAQASWEELFEVWRGLGYYHRAKSMLKTAQIIRDEFKGQFPLDIRSLESLPGIGKYTARAILSFAFHHDVPVVDTNISRVLQRFFNLSNDKNVIWDAMHTLVPPNLSRDFNQGVMELGALVCAAHTNSY